MKVLHVTTLICLFALLLGCGERSTTNSTPIMLPTAVASVADAQEASPTVDEQEAVEDEAVETVVPPADVSDTNEPNLGRLVVVDWQNQLVTVDPDGSGLNQLTSIEEEIIYLFPAWSPDNRSIAAIGAGDKPATDGIYIFADSAESADRVFTADGQQPIYLSWSPDSENVSFITPRLGDSTLLDLRVVPRDGAERSRYLAFGQPFYWDWNSTGDEIVFNTNRTTHAKFGYVDPFSGEIGEDVAETADYFQSPDLSHDDAYLAYSDSADDANRIVIEDRATGEVVTADYKGLTTLSWSPTVNNLAFIDSIGQTPLPYGSLRLLNTKGQDLTFVADSVIAFFWSPDGSKIAYLTLGRGDVAPEARRGRLSARSAQPFFQTDRLEYQLWVADVVSAEPQLLGAFRPGNLFISQFIPFFGQYAHSHSLWSPDSSSLAMPVETADGVIIYLFPTDGTQPSPITPGRVAFWTRD